MNPDRMVIDEARRTFTYLNLYGFLTDAVIVNRVFPDDVGEYFDGVARDPAARRSPRSSAAFAPVPVLRAPFFEQRGARRGDARPARRRAVRRAGTPRRCCTARSRRSSSSARDGATLRLALPFADKGDLQLKKIGPELIVRVGDHKRTLLLPAASPATAPPARRSRTAPSCRVRWPRRRRLTPSASRRCASACRRRRRPPSEAGRRGRGRPRPHPVDGLGRAAPRRRGQRGARRARPPARVPARRAPARAARPARRAGRGSCSSSSARSSTGGSSGSRTRSAPSRRPSRSRTSRSASHGRATGVWSREEIRMTTRALDESEGPFSPP